MSQSLAVDGMRVGDDVKLPVSFGERGVQCVNLRLRLSADAAQSTRNSGCDQGCSGRCTQGSTRRRRGRDALGAP